MRPQSLREFSLAMTTRKRHSPEQVVRMLAQATDRSRRTITAPPVARRDVARRTGVDEVEVGQCWAYRARGTDSLVQVCVLRIGTKRPARALVRFVADEFEGREDWVPPSRLKAPWPEVEDFLARERRWLAVIDASPVRDTPVDYAAGHAFDTLVPRELATTGSNSTAGVSRIHDVDGLARGARHISR